MAKIKKYKQGLLTSKDLLNGYTTFPQGTDFFTVAPIHCIPLEDKDENYVRHCADWYERIALKELPRKAREYQKLADMAAGIINKSDYAFSENGIGEDLSIKNNNQEDLLNMFFPLAPNIYNTFLGEFIKRDKACVVDAVDPESVSEMLEFKEDAIKQVMGEYLMQTMQDVPRETEEQNKAFMQELEASKKLQEVETRFRKFRTRAAKWGTSFIEKYSRKHNMEEMLQRLFADAIRYDEYIIGLDLKDSDFFPVYLDPRKTYVNISPSKIDYSDANFIVNIDFESIPDILNKSRNELTPEQVESLERSYTNILNNVILSPNQMASGDGYYDTSKSYEANMRYGINVRQTMSTEAINRLFTDSNNDYSSALTSYANMFNNTRMIRVTKVWWCSQRKVGLLTSVDAEGNLVAKEVDENFKVTIPPTYDNSLLKEKTAQTLLYGEHVDWEWVNEWRYVKKYGENVLPNEVTADSLFSSIYVGGKPMPYQFKSTGNKYDAKPPIQGRRISDPSTVSSSLVKKLRPFQIPFNILLNKVLALLPDDIGPVIMLNDSDIQRDTLEETDGIAPLIETLENIRKNKVYVNRDLDTGNRKTGNSREPRVLDISTIDKIQTYLSTAIMLRQMAYDTIGVSAQRLSQVGKSESATGIQQAVEGSVNQTEIYFHTFLAHGLPKIWQMIVDAGQWYTANKETFIDSYINDREDRVLFEVAKDDLFRDLLVSVVYSAREKEFLSTLKQLTMQDNTMGATFLDKVKVLRENTSTKIIENLEVAEAKRQEQERERYQEQMKMQEEKEAEALKRQQEMMDAEMQKFYDKLENDYNIAALRVTGTPKGNSVEFAKLQQQASQKQADSEFKDRQLSQQSTAADKAVSLRERELDIKQREAELNYAIAVENKQKADVQFRQLKK